MGYFYISLMVLFTTLGQLLTKKGADKLTDYRRSSGWLRAACLNPYIILAALITAAAPLFYILALRELSLSVAFAFTGLNYVLVSLGGKFVFREKLNSFHYAGMVLVFLGITVFNC